MKVLIIDTSGKEGVAQGGASRVAGNLFHELRKRGIKTYYLGYRNELIRGDSSTFIMGGAGVQAKARSLAKAGALRSLAETRAARIAYYSVHSIVGVALGGAARWIEELRPDIVVASSVQDYITLKRLKPRLHGAKLVYIEHANASGSYASALDYNILGLTFGTGPYAGLEAAKRRFFTFFDAVVALNREQYRSVAKYNRDVVVIHSGMLMDPRRPTARQLDAARKGAGVSQKDGVVLYFGRLLEAQKNISSLIMAFKQIKSERLKLLIVGNGRSYQLYKDMSADDSRIKVISGRVSDREAASYYCMADLFILPSLFESFNATFIEAAYFGDALLLSAKSINEDIIERFGDALYTFDPANASELKRKIERYFADRALRRRLAALSMEITREYSRKRQMDAYAAALNALYTTGRMSGTATL